MIIWIASYPKSGNTWVRFFILSILFGNKNEIDLNHLKKIEQFPIKSQFDNIGLNSKDLKNLKEISKNWINAQKKINLSNKIQFYKTHNLLCQVEKNSFTDYKNTLGVIYIVRDPRNIITSITHHYSVDYEKALQLMIDENSSLLETSFELDHSNFTYLNSWSNHYKSWKNNSNFQTLFIKYEDIEEKKEDTFEKIITFVNKLSNKNLKIDKNKFINSVKSTNFSNLRNKELNEGFEESIISSKTGKKINFFNLGFNNRWQKILTSDIKNKVENKFSKEIKELRY